MLASGSAGAKQRTAGRYIVTAKSPEDLQALKADLSAKGAKVDDSLSAINAVSVDLDGAGAGAVAASSHVASLGKSGIRRLIDPEGAFSATPTLRKTKVADPASSLPGLMWNLDRIESPAANSITDGRKNVIVGVADTGLDFTHSELAKQIVHVEDFTGTENPPICKTFCLRSRMSSWPTVS